MQGQMLRHIFCCLPFHVIVLLISADTIATVNSLNSKNAREHWEKEFNLRYIQPVLGNLDARLNTAMDLITKDDKQGMQNLCKVRRMSEPMSQKVKP